VSAITDTLIYTSIQSIDISNEKDTIWIATNEGIVVYDIDSDSSFAYDNENTPSVFCESCSNKTVYKLKIDSQ
jgi:ligand-binding sensor domain-containing protein